MQTQSILTFSVGAVALAAIYHIILFAHRQDGLLKYYCLYLWILLFYLMYRLLMGKTTGKMHINSFGIDLAVDATFLMATYLAYIKFWGIALLLSKKDGQFIWIFYRSAFPIIIIYIIWETFSLNINSGSFNDIIDVSIRIYLCCTGFLAMLYAIKRRRNLYYYYLACGTTAILITGLFSTYVEVLENGKFLNIGSFGWILFGYFLDVIFFSAAIGYKLRSEASERIIALKKVVEQQHEIRRNSLEKIEAIYLAREEERSRIIADLHDDVGATLSSMHLYGNLAQNVWQTQPHKSREMVGNISDLAKDLMARMGDIVWSMKPAGDEKFSLEARMMNYCTELLQPRNIIFTIDFDRSLDSRISQPEFRKNILLIAKEALNNIAKYSSTTNATIRLARQGDDVELTITDNGHGYDATKVIPGNGLQNIRQRCLLLNGNCHIEAKLGIGVTVQCRFPIAIFSNGIYTNGQ